MAPSPTPFRKQDGFVGAFDARSLRSRPAPHTGRTQPNVPFDAEVSGRSAAEEASETAAGGGLGRFCLALGFLASGAFLLRIRPHIGQQCGLGSNLGHEVVADLPRIIQLAVLVRQAFAHLVENVPQTLQLGL